MGSVESLRVIDQSGEDGNYNECYQRIHVSDVVRIRYWSSRFIEQGEKSFREVVCEPVLCCLDDFDPTEE